MNFKKHVRETGLGFQIAPMIDIVFLLLIFFITASIYAQWESKMGIKVPTTKSGQYEVRMPGEVIINIDPAGRISMNLIEYSPERLSKLLGELAATYPDQPVIIRADRATPYEHVIMVLDICRSVDISSISFATVPQQEPASNQGR